MHFDKKGHVKMPKDLTKKQIKKEIESYDEMIHGENSCYGTKDIRYYYMLLDEAEKRGLKMRMVVEG